MPERRRPRRILQRVNSGLRTAVDWVRAGYSDDAPSQGHSPLVALHGPSALTPKQTDQIIDELGGRQPADAVEIQVAITKATGRLPTDTQIGKVTRALDQRTRGQ